MFRFFLFSNMAQILKPKPINKAFETVELIHGSEWKWSVPNNFTFDQKTAFQNVRYDACTEWIIAEIKKNDTPLKEAGYVSPFADTLERAIAGSKQMQYIPDEETVNKYIGRFFYGNNTEVRKKQIDIICKPIADAPLASTILDQADEEVIQSIFDFFYEGAYAIKAKPKKDSGQSEKSSSEKTEEPNT